MKCTLRLFCIINHNIINLFVWIIFCNWFWVDWLNISKKNFNLAIRYIPPHNESVFICWKMGKISVKQGVYFTLLGEGAWFVCMKMFCTHPMELLPSPLQQVCIKRQNWNWIIQASPVLTWPMGPDKLPSPSSLRQSQLQRHTLQPEK